MRLLVPVISANDVFSICPDSHETDFYCGFLPHWWKTGNDSRDYMRKGVLSAPINNRNSESSNVCSLDELHKLVEVSKQKRARLYITLNAKHYPEHVYPELTRFLNEITNVGVSRLIVCDEGLVRYLSIYFPTVKVSISCLAQVSNSYAARHYLSYGNVERIVFPRHLSAKEMVSIATDVPELEFEYFIFSNKCPYDDGYCRSLHEFSPLCRERFVQVGHSRSSQSYSFSRYSEIVPDFESRGYRCPNFSCAACVSIECAEAANIVSAKIAFRGHDLERRKWLAELANVVLVSGKTKQDIRQMVSSSYGCEDLCAIGIACMN